MDIAENERSIKNNIFLDFGSSGFMISLSKPHPARSRVFLCQPLSRHRALPEGTSAPLIQAITLLKFPALIVSERQIVVRRPGHRRGHAD